MKEKCDMRKGYHSLSENSSASSTAVEDEEWNCGKSEEKSDNENDYEPAETSKKIKRGHKKFVTPKLVAALDRCQLSIRDSIYILQATAEAMGHNLDELVINSTPLHRFIDVANCYELNVQQTLNKNIKIRPQIM